MNRKEYAKQYYELNKERLREYRKEYRKRPDVMKRQKEYHKLYTQRYRETEKGKEVTQRAWLKYKYNMSLKEYNIILEKQNNRCAICKEKQFHSMHISLYVDHNHKT